MGPGSNKRPDKQMNISDAHRWNLLQLAISNDSLFVADDFEMKQDASAIYTYFTMEHYKQLYPLDQVYFIMGADLLVDIAKGEWLYGKELVENNLFLVMSRDGINMKEVISSSAFLQPYSEHFHLIEKGMNMEISSSYIRGELRKHPNARHLKHLMPCPCYDYIMEHGLYQF